MLIRTSDCTPPSHSLPSHSAAHPSSSVPLLNLLSSPPKPPSSTPLYYSQSTRTFSQSTPTFFHFPPLLSLSTIFTWATPCIFTLLRSATTSDWHFILPTTPLMLRVALSFLKVHWLLPTAKCLAIHSTTAWLDFFSAGWLIALTVTFISVKPCTYGLFLPHSLLSFHLMALSIAWLTLSITKSVICWYLLESMNSTWVSVIIHVRTPDFLSSSYHNRARSSSLSHCFLWLSPFFPDSADSHLQSAHTHDPDCDGIHQLRPLHWHLF